MDAMDKAIVFVRGGASVKQASEEFGIPSTTLRRKLREVGVSSSMQVSHAYNLTQKDKIRQLRKDGMSYSEISRQTKVNEASIKSWCSDIILSDAQNKKNLGVDKEKQDRAILLRKEGKYFKEIAKELNCSASSVLLWVNTYVEETGEDINKKAHERKKRETDESSGANNVSLDKVIESRLAGFSLKEIAENMGTSPHVVKVYLDQHQFTGEDLKKIKKNSLLHARERRKNGEAKPQGGAREGSGRSKTGYYKGIYCGSTYELCWVIYSLDHHVEFSRFSGSLVSGKTRYYPDFLLADGKTIIELKGYEFNKSVQKKTKVAEKHGYKVVVLRKGDLSDVFQYVKEKYGVDQEKSYVLYDGFKPRFTYCCHSCGTEFHSENKRKKEITFCSRSCSGKNQGPKALKTRVCAKEFKSKLSKEEIISIFYADGTYKQIAEQYEIHTAMVGFIKNKKVHKELLKDL